MTRICLVEDEVKVAGFIKKGLEEYQYLVDIAANGSSGIQLIKNYSHDLLILDIMLPDMSGMDICREVRRVNKQIPILMLTALGTIDDKVAGLKAGADDYLVKPFHFVELLARIEALLRRGGIDSAATKIFTFSDLKLDTGSKVAERNDQKIPLTAKEYDLLNYFMQNPNKMLSRQDIAEKVWGIGFDTGTNVIDVYINFLRKKIERGFTGRLIHTVIGMGYILKEEE